MILFTKIMQWYTGLMFIGSVGFLVWIATVDGSGVRILAWVLLSATFAIQFFTFRSQKRTAIERREREAEQARRRKLRARIQF